MNNKKYWEKFYRKFDEKNPSNFAKFCSKYITKNDWVLDIGCGNGRDSYFLGKHAELVLGVDYATEPKDNKRVLFTKIDIKDFSNYDFSCFDIVYTRFFLNSISNKKVEELVKWTRGLFLIECRAKGDKPKLFPKHKRNLIDGEWLLKLLIDNGFEILYYKKGHGMSVYKNEDPLLIRVVAKK
jgi:SAM-dependent methyltransferase